ncbi:MAG: DUF433 domain-containing protein [Candidatus Aenigmarchaeota archaeon]|nr:DUF433 domain-containing protein [Candidatus Aenigmarchaeota archaeon]
MALLESTSRIVKDQSVCGGSPRIEGTRIRVMDVVEKYEFLEYSPNEVAEAFAISLAQVFSALAYYYEHPEEIKEEMRAHEEFIEKLRHGQ